MLMNYSLSQLDIVEGETIGGVWLRMLLSDSTYLQSADEIIAMMWNDMHLTITKGFFSSFDTLSREIFSAPI